MKLRFSAPTNPKDIARFLTAVGWSVGLLVAGYPAVGAELDQPMFVLVKDGDVYAARGLNGHPAALTQFQNGLRETEVHAVTSDGTQIFFSTNSDAETEEMKLEEGKRDILPEREYWLCLMDGSERARSVAAGMFEERIISPDGKHIATVECDDADCMGLSISRTSDGQPIASITRSDLQNYPQTKCAWSQDGARLYYLDNQRFWPGDADDNEDSRDIFDRRDFYSIRYYELATGQSKAVTEHLWPTGGLETEHQIHDLTVTKEGILVVLADRTVKSKISNAFWTIIFCFDPRTEMERLFVQPDKGASSTYELVPSQIAGTVLGYGTSNGSNGLRQIDLTSGLELSWTPLPVEFTRKPHAEIKHSAFPITVATESFLIYETESAHGPSETETATTSIIAHDLRSNEKLSIYRGFRLGAVWSAQ